jgi:PAS domain S-box-containing protein
MTSWLRAHGWLWFFLCGLLLQLNAAAANDAPPAEVLIIHSYDRDFAPDDTVDEVFQAELTRLSYPRPVEYLHVYPGRAEFESSDRDEAILAYLRATCGPRGPDLIVAIGAAAQAFVVRQEAILYPNIPVLNLAAETRRDSTLRYRDRTVSVSYGIDLSQLVENVLQLLPDTKHVFVAMGAGSLERFWEPVFREVWKPFEPRLQFEWMSDLSLEQMKVRVAALPPDSVVLAMLMLRDATGQASPGERALEALYRTANTPIFGYSEAQLGRGIVGGSLLALTETGRGGAEVAKRLLDGEEPGTIDDAVYPALTPAYDWRELHRWGIPEERLTPGSRVDFRKPSPWVKYRWIIVGSVGLFLLQTTLIVGLLVQRHHRRVAERTAQESKDRLALAAELSGVGLWSLDLRSHLIWMSERATELFGFLPGQQVSIALFLESVHAEDRASVQSAIDAAVESGVSTRVEYRFVLPDGAVRWIVAQGQTCPSPPASPTLFMGASLDISENKAGEETLRQAKDFSEAAINALPGIFYLYNSEGRLVRWNRNHELKTGFSAEELNGRPILDWFPESHRDLVALEVRRVHEDGEGRIEAPVRMKDGHEVPYLLKWVGLMIEGESYILGTGTDISDIKWMEACRDAVREVLRILSDPGDIRESMQSIVSAIKASLGVDAVGIRLRDVDDYTYFCSEGFSEDFLTKENSLVSRNGDGGICRDDKGEPILQCACGLVLSGKTDPANPLFTPGGSCWTNDAAPLLDLPAKDDPRTNPRNVCIHQGYASVALIPIRGKGEVIGLLQLNARRKGYFTLPMVEFLERAGDNMGEAMLRRQGESDIAQARLALAHLSRVSMMSELTTSLAHELNQPLAAILSNAQAGLRFLSGKEPDLNEVAEILADIVSDDKRAGEIIRRTRYLLQNDPPHREWLDLSVIVREVVSILHNAVVIHDVLLETDLSPSVPHIRGDRVQLQQVLINLIINAEQAMIEACSRPATVSISTFKDHEGRAVVTVQDTGPGVPASQLEEIFVPFYSRKTGGMGMGLTISRSLLQSVGGKIWAENAPGGGARFSILFEQQPA